MWTLPIIILVAAIAVPFIGMCINCVFGGKGVGMINLLLLLIVGVFIAGQMVGRTPEYLGRKVGAREMKLAMIALLVHPIPEQLINVLKVNLQLRRLYGTPA